MMYRRPAQTLLLAMLCGAGAGAAGAPTLDAHFSCSAPGNDGEKLILADNAEMRLDGKRIEAFRWESDLFRSTHGFDCSIDQGDGLHAEVGQEGATTRWRIALNDPQAARRRRGYDFDRLPQCTIRLERTGERLDIVPDCPALCGSRGNFTRLSVDLKTGNCHYGK